MNSPRQLSSPLSGVFVPTKIPQPKIFGKSPKASKGSGCYPSQARGREEITQSVCSPTAGTSFLRRRSPGFRGKSPEPQSPQVQRRTSGRPSRGGQSPPPCVSLPLAVRRSQIPRPGGSRKLSMEAEKTLHAIDDALSAVQSALTTKLMAADHSPSAGSEDLESLCGTECTESTACSSTFSEDCSVSGRPFKAPLHEARRTLKERIGASERSMRFTRGLLAKLDELRDAVADDGSEAA